MTLAAAILIAMLRLPCPADEPVTECAPWREVVAQAIADVAEEATCTSEWSRPECKPLWSGAPDALAAVLVEVAYHESGLRRRIQAGTCHKDECDPNGSGGHYAHSMWQLHESPDIVGIDAPVPRSVWRASVGTIPEAIMTGARAATRLLVLSPRAFGLSALLGPGKRGMVARRILLHMREVP